MFNGFTDRTLDFMWGVRLNNNKPWFEEHKEQFKSEFQTPMKELGQEVFERLNDACGDRGFIHKLSRIYKDARRLHGEGPYRDNMWFSIERPSEEWTSVPVFWFELSPGEWSYGMGYYQARPQTMAKLRARIDRDPRKFEKLVAPLAAQDEFLLDGDEYKRRKEAPTAKTETWYNLKSFSLIHSQQIDPLIYTRELADRLVAGYSFLMPFYDYFVTLDSDPAPTQDT